MQLGLGSYSFRWAIGTPSFRPARPLTPIDLVQRTSQFGCTLLQIADHPGLDSATDKELVDLKMAAQEYGVTLEIGTSGATQTRLLRYLNIARLLDAKLVRVVLDGPDAHPTLKDAEEIIRAVAMAYQDEGVTLAIENHFLLPSPLLLSLIENIANPSVGICLDTANSVACQEWPLDTVRMLAPYAVNVHLKDFRLDPHPEGVGVLVSGTPLGEGRQDITAVLQSIAATGKDLNVLLEQWLPRQTDEENTLSLEMDWTQRSITAARSHLGRIAG